MRLFVAVDVGEATRRAVQRLQRRAGEALGDRRGDLKWVRPEHQHLTLAFIGEVGEPQAERIRQAISVPLPLAPFQVEFGGIGMFPAHGAPKVLWIGVTRGAAQTIQLAGEVAARLREQGVTLDPRPFQPHLTLARWKSAGPRDRRQIDAMGGAAAIAPFEVESVTLYRSQLSTYGPMYTALARGPLCGESG